MDRGLPAPRQARAGAFRHAREDDPHDAAGGAARGGADQPACPGVAGRAFPAPARLLGQARAGAAETGEVGLEARPVTLVATIAHSQARPVTLVATIARSQARNVTVVATIARGQARPVTLVATIARSQARNVTLVATNARGG